MTTVIFPMVIIITPKTAYILQDNTEPRRIFTDGREWPTEFEPSFEGLSISTWVDEDADGKYTRLKSQRVEVRARSRIAASACTMTIKPSSKSESNSTKRTKISCTTKLR
jgi:hypothetical protein